MCPLAGEYCLCDSEAESVCDVDEADDFGELEIGPFNNLVDTAASGNEEKYCLNDQKNLEIGIDLQQIQILSIKCQFNLIHTYDILVRLI